MSNLIYYFSGTGNSLKVAKDISKQIDGNLIRISESVNEVNFDETPHTLGLIFPVYHATFGESGIPHIVEHFVNKLNDISSLYIYAICTHAGFAGSTIENLSKLLSNKNGTLSLGYSVKMSIPYSTFDKIKHLIFKRELKNSKSFEKRIEVIRENWNQKKEIIIDNIHKRNRAKHETSGKIINLFCSPLYVVSKFMAKSYYEKLSNKKSSFFFEITHFADKSFKTNHNCNGCGVCMNVCPANNISLVNSKPVWHHNCENCFACYQWCPSQAIGGEIVQFQRKYHFDDITIKDMIRK